MVTQTYPVQGMTCGGCVRHVEKALRATPGVLNATVDLTASNATVEGDATYASLAAKLAEAGYTLLPPV